MSGPNGEQYPDTELQPKFSPQRHIESCTKRKRKEDEVEHVAKSAREEEVHSYNQAPIEDVPSDENKTCCGTLQTKIWKPRGSRYPEGVGKL